MCYYDLAFYFFPIDGSHSDCDAVGMIDNLLPTTNSTNSLDTRYSHPFIPMFLLAIRLATHVGIYY